MKGNNRGQAFTLEAFFAVLIILSAIVFALQATALTPLTSSTSSQQIRNQQSTLSEGFTTSAYQNGTLKSATLYWIPNPDFCTPAGDEFTAPDDGRFASSDTVQTTDIQVTCHYSAKAELPVPIRNQVIESYGNTTAVNIQLEYYNKTASGELKQETITYLDEGRPTENTVTVERQVILYDKDKLTTVNDGRFVPAETSKTLENETNFYADDVSPNTDLYNVVTVKVTVWRI